MNCKRGRAPFLTLFLLAAACSGEPAAPAFAEDSVRVIDVAAENRAYVTDPLWIAPAGQIFAVDIAQQNFLGMIDTGYMPAFAIAPDHSSLYVAETFFSRGSRGEQTDVLTVYDARTLLPGDEIKLPPGRFLTAGKKERLTITPDGRTLLLFHLTTDQSVTAIDVRGRRVSGQTDTHGCTLTYPGKNNHFAMICTDGSMLSVHVNDGDFERVHTRKFFDPDRDPLMDQAAFDRAASTVYFVSYDGVIYAATIGDESIDFPAQWTAISAADRAQGWRAGGAQMLAVSGAINRLYLLVHRGGRFTHKEAGTEVWIYDLAQRKRLQRLTLPQPVDSIAISAGAAPRLLALSSDEAALHIYDARTLRPLGAMEEMGYGPSLIMVHGD